MKSIDFLETRSLSFRRSQRRSVLRGVIAEVLDERAALEAARQKVAAQNEAAAPTRPSPLPGGLRVPGRHADQV